MKNIFLSIIVATFVLIVPFVTTSNVKAAGVAQCLPGTGVNGIPCEVCYVNSYGICVPDLGIDDSEPIFRTENALVAAAFFTAGLVLFANGSVMKSKLK
ncbi:hypothetical protein KC669_03375 [Candidatus Dojkabacteria bacterium]|uniref:Uncharacterized protein n=1 Tax=Candidatus Dojkabacteria bacterium TaxID=2099670 RepID=A0A955LA99_9BACT|nr:hypothetical protein [Candidatus Dojkabacteria bacterium]